MGPSSRSEAGGAASPHGTLGTATRERDCVPDWLLPLLVPMAAALAGALLMLAFRPRGGAGGEAVLLLAERMEALSQRLDTAVAAQSERMHRALADAADRTQDSARRIHERLAVID